MMPSTNRRKKLHWKRVEHRKRAEEMALKSILPNTVAGQGVCDLDTKHDMTSEGFELVPCIAQCDVSETVSNRYACTIS